MAWIPVTAAGVINGIGHYWGYRNFASADASTNIVPWGILIGGEELHNNHHAYGTSAKLSSRWYEFDLGWTYIRILEMLGLATVRKVAPKLRVAARGKPAPDLATLQAVIANRYAVATTYARTLKADLRGRARPAARAAGRGEFADLPSMRRLKHWLSGDTATRAARARAGTLAKALEKSKALSTIYAMRQELNVLWERSTESSEQLLARLQDWCRRAEASGIAPLAQFSLQLQALRVTRPPQAKSPPVGGLFHCPADRSAAGGPHVRHARAAPHARAPCAAVRHLSFVSLYMTCLRATGSNFLISIFSGISFLFFIVV